MKNCFELFYDKLLCKNIIYDNSILILMILLLNLGKTKQNRY